MGATNSWKCQDIFVNQTVCIFSTQTWILAHWLKTFVRYTHLNLLHEHNVIYAKETYLLCLFERSFDDDNDADLLRRNLSKRGASSGSFRRQLQFASSRVDPASLARAGSRVAVVDSSNLPSAVVLPYTLVRFTDEAAARKRNSL